MKRTIFILTFLFVAVAYGQEDERRSLLIDKNQFIASWDIAFPANAEFLDKTSFSGARLEYRKLVNRNFAWGIASGWNSYRQKVDQQLYETEDGSRAVFTDMIRKVNEIPIVLGGYYYLDLTSSFRPYAGLGIGALYSQQKVFFNVYVIEENNWGFLVRPEIGIQYDFNYSVGLHVYGAYSYGSNNNESFRINSLEHFTAGIGLVWSY